MLTKIEPVYLEEGSRIFSAVELAYQKDFADLLYRGDGICAVHLAFAVSDDEILTAPSRLLSEEETIHRVE